VAYTLTKSKISFSKKKKKKSKKYKVKNIHNQQNGTTWQAIYREVVSDRVGTWKLLGSDANLQLLF
jgi:hypothetical protein